MVHRVLCAACDRNVPTRCALDMQSPMSYALLVLTVVAMPSHAIPSDQCYVPDPTSGAWLDNPAGLPYGCAPRPAPAPTLPEAITDAGAQERAATWLAMGHFGPLGADECHWALDWAQSLWAKLRKKAEVASLLLGAAFGLAALACVPLLMRGDEAWPHWLPRPRTWEDTVVRAFDGLDGSTKFALGAAWAGGQAGRSGGQVGN